MCAFVANSNIGWTGAENVEWQLGLVVFIPPALVLFVVVRVYFSTACCIFYF